MPKIDEKVCVSAGIIRTKLGHDSNSVLLVLSIFRVSSHITSNDYKYFISGPFPQGMIFLHSGERALPKNMQRALKRTVPELR